MTTADYDFININADYKRLDELFGNPEQLSYETFSERVKGTEIALTCNTEKKMILLYTTYMLRDFKKSIGEPTFLTTTEVILGIYFFCGEQKYDEFCGEQKYDEVFSDDGI